MFVVRNEESSFFVKKVNNFSFVCKENFFARSYERTHKIREKFRGIFLYKGFFEAAAVSPDHSVNAWHDCEIKETIRRFQLTDSSILTLTLL